MINEITATKICMVTTDNIIVVSIKISTMDEGVVINQRAKYVVNIVILL